MKKYIIEICKTYAAQHGTKKAIQDGMFNIWTDERIKGAFSNGRGTMADFKRYKTDNAANCIIKEIDKKQLAELYPNY